MIIVIIVIVAADVAFVVVFVSLFHFCECNFINMTAIFDEIPQRMLKMRTKHENENK